MSAALNTGSEWNFRILDKRLVTVKSKAPSAGKVAVLDALTNILFMVHVTPGVSAMPIEELEIGKEYIFNLRVETSKDLSGVKADAISFFEALDIDQTMEDFIKAYWLYPNKVRFQLTEAEEP